MSKTVEIYYPDSINEVLKTKNDPLEAGALEDSHRGKFFQPRELEVEKLVESVNSLCKEIQNTLYIEDNVNKKISLEKLEISACIGLSGKITLLGTGVEASAQGTIKLVFGKS